MTASYADMLSKLEITHVAHEDEATTFVEKRIS